MNTYNSGGGFGGLRPMNQPYYPNQNWGQNQPYYPNQSWGPNQSYNCAPTFFPETKGAKGANGPNVGYGNYGTNIAWNQAPEWKKLPNMSWGCKPNEYYQQPYQIKKMPNPYL